MQNIPFKDKVVYSIGGFVVFACILYFFLITFITANKESINIVAPVFTSTLAALVGYFFGSSASGQKKDDTIKDLTLKQ